MAPRVDFYVLSTENNQALLLTVCRLLEKAYQQKKQVFVLCKTAEEKEILNKLLWTFNDTSFIPHQLWEGKVEPDVPIYIADTSDNPPELKDILINLSVTVPAFFNQFERVIEMVNANNEIKSTSREKFKFYRESQCELNSHSLS